MAQRYSSEVKSLCCDDATFPGSVIIISFLLISARCPLFQAFVANIKLFPLLLFLVVNIFPQILNLSLDFLSLTLTLL